jgi:polyhydroxyalkanoate synthesis regulator phasin
LPTAVRQTLNQKQLKTNSMEDAFKKFLYAGVDLAAEVSTKFEESVKDLIEKGKISDVEGKKLVDELFEKTEARKEEFEAKYNEIKEKVGIIKKTEEEILADLKSKVADLESKIGKVSTKATPKAAATA